MVMTEPGPKSLAEVEFGPVYQIPLMITLVISLLCEWSGLSVPAGTLRIWVYAPVLGSPERPANCMPFLSGSSTHFKSVKETMNGLLPSGAWAPSCASNRIETHTTAIAAKNAFIQSSLVSVFLLLEPACTYFCGKRRVAESRMRENE